MLVYDFEVFAYDWVLCALDTDDHWHVIHNDRDALFKLWTDFKNDIWVGYNSRHYDKWILSCILSGINPKALNDWIILKGNDAHTFSPSNHIMEYPIINFDVMPNPPVGLKTIEGFLGDSVQETETPFDLDRPLNDKELQQTIFYCKHDVEETAKVFIQRYANFEAMLAIVRMFDMPMRNIGDTEAQITAKALGCVRHDWDDEFDIFILPCVRLHKYHYVQEWYEQLKPRMEALYGHYEDCKDYDERLQWRKNYYSQKLITMVAGVPHTFAFGGLHGAVGEIKTSRTGKQKIVPKHIIESGSLWHVDVSSYYPSMLIAWDLVTRSATNDNYTKVYFTRIDLKKKQIEAKKSGNDALAKHYKSEQLPYKKMLNALSGAQKDKNNPGYDPRNNSVMCINGQLMLLMLIERLEEGLPGFELLQSNTDGLIVKIPDTQKAFEQLDDICYGWECDCSTSKCNIALETDQISYLVQGDVNNYLWVDAKGGVERKGKYVKELSDIDYDLPIVNKAIVAYLVDKTPVEETVYGCDSLREFQKLVKLSDKYEFVMHNGEKYTNKSYRVYASNRSKDGVIYKCKITSDGKYHQEKFADTPERCFIMNDDTAYSDAMKLVDRQYYVNLTKRRLHDKFGV